MAINFVENESSPKTVAYNKKPNKFRFTRGQGRKHPAKNDLGPENLIETAKMGPEPNFTTYVCMYECMYACMHVCMYVCVGVYIGMYVCYIYVACMYLSFCVYIYMCCRVSFCTPKGP